jgi:hypothetical protein
MKLRFLMKACLITVALVAGLSTASAQDAKATVYKIPEAQIQMNLPPGWSAEKDSKGTIIIMKKDSDGYVLFSMAVLPREPSNNLDALFAAFSGVVLENAKRDWKNFKAGTVQKDTQAQMEVRAQKFEGTMAESGGELEGLAIIIDSPKPLGIFAQRTKKHSELLENEGNAILSSIAKIQ